MSNNNFPEFMDKRTLKKTLYETTKFNHQNKYYGVDFCLHGGEPSLYDTKILEECLEYEELIVEKFFPEMQVTYTLQSNGISFSEDFLRLIKKFKIHVGISIDGPEEINDYHRGKNSLNSALNTLQSLKKHGISHGVLSVINEKHLKSAEQIFKFYINNEIKSVGILKQFSDYGRLDNIKLAEFLIDLFDYYFYSEYKMDIREFNFAIRNCLSTKNSGSCSMKYRESCGNYLTVATNGEIFFCDDVLEIENSFGNININEIPEILSSEKYINKVLVAKSVMSECLECNVYSICRTGCHRHDVEGKNYFCETYKIFYKHVYEIVQNEAKGGE